MACSGPKLAIPTKKKSISTPPQETTPTLPLKSATKNKISPGYPSPQKTTVRERVTSRCPSRSGIAKAMGSRGAAPRSMSWATMRQRARAADCWPAAPPCLNKRGPASRAKVSGPRAGLSLSKGWPTLLRQASVRRTGAAWILSFTAPRAWAKRCAARPRSLLRSVATADRSHARPRRTAQPLR